MMDEGTGGTEAPLFPPGSTLLLRVLLGSGLGAAIAFVAALIGWPRTPYATGARDPKMQPVKFDHRHHVLDDGIQCTYCHSEVRRSAVAGLPGAAMCMGCHAQIWTESPELAPVRAAYFNDRPLAWQRVTRLPDFVFFDHSIHVSKGVGCVSCHGRVDLMAEVYAVKSFTMQTCLDCHRNPVPFLRPKQHVTDMGWRPQAADDNGLQLKERYHVQPSTDCSTCHR